MKKIKYILLTLGLLAGFGLTLLPANVSAEYDPLAEVCKNEPTNPICVKDPNKSAGAFIKNLVNSLLYVLAAVSVVVIIFSGIFYVTSNGSAEMITKAKNTLMYAVIGLIVAIMAYAIVNFVIKAF